MNDNDPYYICRAPVIIDSFITCQQHIQHSVYFRPLEQCGVYGHIDGSVQTAVTPVR